MIIYLDCALLIKNKHGCTYNFMYDSFFVNVTIATIAPIASIIARYDISNRKA